MPWTLVRTGEDHGAISNHMEWQLDSEDDINSPPPEAESAAPGSKAWTGDYAHYYNKTNQNTWVEIVVGSGGSGGSSGASSSTVSNRITPLSSDELAIGTIIEVIGIPTYVDDISAYSDYNITESGWYIFSRIFSKNGATVSASTTVIGSDGYIAIAGNNYIDVAVRFEVAAVSKKVVIDWGPYAESFIYRASDLAIRNLDYRTTFYVYDVDQYITWTYDFTTDATFDAKNTYFTLENGEYVKATPTAGEAVPAYFEKESSSYTLTTDTTFADGKTYYTESNGEYTPATVTTGEAVTADTYYNLTEIYKQTTDTTFVSGKTYYTKSDTTYTVATVTVGDPIPAYYKHAKVRFEGMTRNVTYQCNTVIDCPMEFVLPVIEDETHGCWFEIRCMHAGEYSMTLIPPSDDIKIATEHTQKEREGVNMINLQYTCINGSKLWRFMNTHSSYPTT